MFRFTVLVGLAGFALGELDFNCTSPSLGVSFAASLTKYTAAVQCGNLFLQGDTPQQPSVVLGEAADALYTLVMIDPDANMNGSWPLTTEAGDHAPVRHWVVGNIPGAALATAGANLTAAGDELTPFKSPGPLGGSHRYGLFVFAQPSADPIVFDAFDNDVRTTWDYDAWLGAYGLGEKVASNYMIVQTFSCVDYDPLACF